MRPGERAVSDEYLEEVVKAYEHFFFHYTSSDLLIVNTSDIDFVDRNEDLQELLRKVTEPIKGTQYFLPLGRAGSGGSVVGGLARWRVSEISRATTGIERAHSLSPPFS